MSTTPNGNGPIRRRGPAGSAAGLLLVVGLIWLQRGSDGRDLLDQMARRSLPLDTALHNGRPTLVEFYADWCESCRTMASIETMQEQHPEIDLVLLNVDNPAWEAQIKRFGVNGIPHLQLFDADGKASAVDRCPPATGT